MNSEENKKPEDSSDGFDETKTDDILEIINRRHRENITPAPDPTTEMKSIPRLDKEKIRTYGNINAETQKNSHTDSVASGSVDKGRKNEHKPVSNAHKAVNSAKNATSASTVHRVSLDDFTDPVNQKTVNKKSSSAMPIISGIAKIIIYLVAVFAISIFISINAIKIGNDVFAFVKGNEEITVSIPENADTSEIAKILYDSGVIKYPSVYKKYTSFRIKKRSYLTGEYKSGDITVNTNQNYDQLLETLSVIANSNKIVRVTIPEGYTVNEILKLFEANGMKKPEEFTSALQEFEYEYRFMDEMSANPISDYRFDINYGYRLEGYLFPDTYDFYVDENPVSVISKLLDNFEIKFDTSFYDRCHELGYTVDEIITLASLIESEGNKVEDYAKISSVFHNRLNNPSVYPYLESDATVQYALGTHKNRLESGDTDVDSPYNTYKYKGLPPGPICNPGYESIYAALYPEDTNYYYFLSRSDGVTVYSTTYDEHLSAINESNKLDAQNQ